MFLWLLTRNPSPINYHRGYVAGVVVAPTREEACKVSLSEDRGPKEYPLWVAPSEVNATLIGEALWQSPGTVILAEFRDEEP
jgi:hypothetical protein